MLVNRMCSVVRDLVPFLPYLFILAAHALSNGLLEFSSNIICREISVSDLLPFHTCFLQMMVIYLWSITLIMLGV